MGKQSRAAKDRRKALSSKGKSRLVESPNDAFELCVIVPRWCKEALEGTPHGVGKTISILAMSAAQRGKLEAWTDGEPDTALPVLAELECGSMVVCQRDESGESGDVILCGSDPPQVVTVKRWRHCPNGPGEVTTIEGDEDSPGELETTESDDGSDDLGAGASDQGEAASATC